MNAPRPPAQVTGFTEPLQAAAPREAGAYYTRQWRATLPAGTAYFRQLFVRRGADGNFSRRVTGPPRPSLFDSGQPILASVCAYRVLVRPRGFGALKHEIVMTTPCVCPSAPEHYTAELPDSFGQFSFLKKPNEDSKCRKPCGAQEVKYGILPRVRILTYILG